MKVKVRISGQVSDYLAARAPDSRKLLTSALKSLGDWDGREHPPRIKHLEDDLTGYSRLRVGAHRLVFTESAVERVRVIDCIYAGPRSSVYEAFAELILDELSS